MLTYQQWGGEHLRLERWTGRHVVVAAARQEGLMKEAGASRRQVRGWWEGRAGSSEHWR